MSICTWNLKKNHKTQTNSKKHSQVFTAIQISFFPAFTLAFHLLQNCKHTIRWDQGLMLWYAAFWAVEVAWVQCQDRGGVSASVLEKLLYICQWTQTASPSWLDSGCCCIQPWQCCRHLESFCLFSVSWRPSCCSQTCTLWFYCRTVSVLLSP